MVVFPLAFHMVFLGILVPILLQVSISHTAEYLHYNCYLLTAKECDINILIEVTLGVATATEISTKSL